MFETSTCNYDYFLFISTLTGSLEIRDYLKKMYIHNTQSEKNIVFDSLMVTTLKKNNVPLVDFAHIVDYINQPISAPVVC